MAPAPYLATVLGLAALCQVLAYRLRVPAILPLLLTGFAFGQLVSPEVVLGRDVLFAGVSVCVGIILFEGSLSLRFKELRGLGKAVWRLCTLTVLLAWVLITCAGLIAGVGWQLALLVGALLVLTGPTVIAPIVRQLRPTRRVSSMLRWEGIVVDPIAAILALLVFQTVIIGGHGPVLGAAVLTLGKTVLVATVLTAVIGSVVETAQRRHMLPDHLDSVVFLGAAVGAQVLSNQVQAESGLLTVTMLGVYLANRPGLRLDHVREFGEQLQILFVGVLFVMLGGRVTPAEVVEVLPVAAIFVPLLILVVRPASIWLGLIGTTATREERTLLSFMAPRGIVAAAVTSVFALEIERAADTARVAALSGSVTPEEQLLLTARAERLGALAEQASVLVPLVFVTIVTTVTVYGLGVGRLAERLGLATTTPNGVLFGGAPQWARQAAEMLGELGVTTVLATSNPTELYLARMAGLRVERTHMLSEYAVEDMELAGIGSFVGATYDDEANATAAREYARTLGSRRTYQVRRTDVPAPGTTQGSASQTRGSTADRLSAHVAFQPPASAAELEEMLRSGMHVRRTRLTGRHTLTDFRRREPDAVLMFVVKGARAEVVTPDTEVPSVDVSIVAMVSKRAAAVDPDPTDPRRAPVDPDPTQPRVRR